MFTHYNKSVKIAPMRRRFTIILSLTLTIGIASADLTEQQAGRITKTVGRIIGQIHYRQIKVNDDISRIHLNNYLNSLDFSHMIFLQSDVDEFKERYATQLDNETQFGKMKPAQQIFDVYIERLTQRQKLVEELLKKKMDYTKKERFNPVLHPADRDKLPWPKSKSEVEDLWRKRIKYELLADRLSLSKDGKPLDAKKLQESHAKISRRYVRLLKEMKGSKRDDILERYLSALARAYDPHSDYMSPHEAENFKINSIDMQLTGIGAVLRVDDGYTTIVRIMPGGPAGRSKLLHANDKVIAVQNPGDKEPTDVIDMKIDKVVQLIRGKKGSDVKLTIIPTGTDERKVITITRDIVKLEDQLAKAFIIERKRDGETEKLGVINLPGFYDKCSDHCHTLIKRLKKEGVDGIVLDLRHNGGGILQEAINLTGLFIEKGPVVQVRDYRGRRRIMDDNNPNIAYNGPLVVAVSHMSASASEIVAAALQDHGRAIVVGGKATHGKGTVQQILPLNRAFIANLNKDSGQLKFTISKFYRINGATTQRDGVNPDVVLPSMSDYLGISEAELPRALESDEIDKAEFKPLNRVEAFFTSLRKASSKRINSDQDYKYIQEDIARARKQKEDRSVSLNEAERRQERAKIKANIEARRKERASRDAPNEKYFETDVKNAATGKPLKKLNAPKPKKENPDPNTVSEDDSNTFRFDPELRETLQILSDFVKLNSKLISLNKK
jgi:carboxyl-terminal processing protease